jgi:hypothetical protein
VAELLVLAAANVTEGGGKSRLAKNGEAEEIEIERRMGKAQEISREATCWRQGNPDSSQSGASNHQKHDRMKPKSNLGSRHKKGNRK